MKSFLLTLFITVNIQAGGLPVYDGLRHVTDLIDNITDITDQISQIKNQIDQIKKLTEQIEQMDDYLDRVGQASKIAVKTTELFTDDINDILKEIEEYTKGEGPTQEEHEENTELYGDIDKNEHLKLNDPGPEQKYDKHERVEKEFFAYKKTSASINQKRLFILAELESLAGLLNSASSDQEVQKLNASINAHKLMLAALKDEEDRQYRSFQAEIRRNENALAKELTRSQERAKFLDEINRSDRKIYKLKKSAQILNLIEGR